MNQLKVVTISDISKSKVKLQEHILEVSNAWSFPGAIHAINQQQVSVYVSLNASTVAAFLEQYSAHASISFLRFSNWSPRR
jgi:hypothetical protein